MRVWSTAESVGVHASENRLYDIVLSLLASRCRSTWIKPFLKFVVMFLWFIVFFFISQTLRFPQECGVGGGSGEQLNQNQGT